MIFRAGLRDPCTRDVARLSESVRERSLFIPGVGTEEIWVG